MVRNRLRRQRVDFNQIREIANFYLGTLALVLAASHRFPARGAVAIVCCIVASGKVGQRTAKSIRLTFD